MKKLSVIVPVYKSEQYLDRCVRSILAQTYSNLEVILVDDGSPDNSGKMCDEFAANDSRVRVIHKANGGVSSARNAGLDAANGDYVAFVDSDDFIAPDMYEKLFHALSGDNCIAMCDCFLHFADQDIPKLIYEYDEDKTRFIANVLVSDIGGSCWNMIVPRKVVGSLRFPTSMNSAEDLWFVLRLFVKAESYAKVNECLYFYDQENLGSLTHSLSDEIDLKVLQGYEEHRTYFKEIGLYNDLKPAWSWAVLRYKSTFLLTPRRFNLYRTILPEANRFVSGNPLLSSRIKLLMKMLDRRLDILVVPIVLLFRLRQCVMHS